jgi:ribose transport system ATP-binding protein
LQQDSEIIIMDEPNSALTESESARLFEIIRRLRDSGITVIYVSHRLEEVFSISDRISVIRDGRYQGTWITAQATQAEIIGAMIGRRLEESFPDRTPNPSAPVLLEMKDVWIGDKIGPVNLTLRTGEILGFAGLEGAGVDEVFHLLFGLERMTKGEIVYKGKPWKAGSPVDAIGKRWALIPASRREHGLMMEWSIKNNATLVVLRKMLNPLGLLSAGRRPSTSNASRSPRTASTRRCITCRAATSRKSSSPSGSPPGRRC